MTVFTVAWMDQGDRVGLCRDAFPVLSLSNAAACDLVPVDAEQAAGKGCAECGESLVGDAREGSRILMQEWEVEHA